MKYYTIQFKSEKTDPWKTYGNYVIDGYDLPSLKQNFRTIRNRQPHLFWRLVKQ